MTDIKGQNPMVDLFAPLRVRIVALILLAVLPALVAIIVTTLSDRRHGLEHAQAEMQVVAVLEARRLSSLVDSVELLSTALAEVHEVASGDRQACAAQLSHVLEASPALANIGRADSAGHIDCSAGPTARSSYPPLAAAARSGGFSLSDGVLAPDGGETLVLAHTLAGSDKVLFMVFKLDWVRSLTAANLPQGTLLTIHSTEGELVAELPIGVMPAHPELPESAPVTAPPKDPLLLLRSEINADGPCGDTPQICSRTGVALGQVAVHIPMEAIYVESNYRMARDLGLLAGVSLLFVLLAWYGIDLLVLRSVRRLLASVQAIRGGDLSARTGLQGRGELAALGRGFDRMADALALRDREAREHLKRVARLNRVYRVLTAMNSAVMRLQDRDELFAEVCRIAVEQGGYPLAWVGVPDSESAMLQPVAVTGSGAGYLKEIAVSSSEYERLGRGPSGIAFRSGEPQICNDIANTPKMAPWKEAAARHGLRASAAFPLRAEHQPVAVLTIYAAETGYFDDDEAQLFTEVASNISYALDHIASLGRLNFMGNFDALTGLPNRALFEDRVQQALARAAIDRRAVAVAALQVNELERINDVHGFATGDDVLMQVSVTLHGHLREGDTLARIGGQTFGVMLDDMQAEHDSFTVMRRIMSAFPLDAQVGDESVTLTARAGITVYPGDSEMASELVRHAELILHSVESTDSTAYHFYSPEVDRDTRASYQLENDLRAGLERGELSLHYQPVLDISSGKTVAMEALARWHHPARGSVSPAEFIPLAERAGLVSVLGEWAMRTARGQGLDWQGRDLFAGRIAVNVSAIELYEQGFVERMRELWSGVRDAPLLTLEVTETQLMHDVDHAIEILSQLQKMGFEIAVDDFGTGYSSLSYLNRLPLNQVKIDRSFVKDLGTDPTAAAVARSIVALSHSLKLTVVAEGVETEEQLQFLTALGCDRAQGYLFSRPLPAEEMEQFLQRG